MSIEHIWKPNQSKLKPNCSRCGCKLTESNRYISNETSRGGGSRRYNYCRSCYLLKVKERSLKRVAANKKLKKEIIIEKGGKCQICGYDDLSCLAVFDFHHIDSKTKDMSISVGQYRKTLTQRSPKIIRQETAKCIVVCANCHRKIHFPDKGIENVN